MYVIQLNCFRPREILKVIQCGCQKSKMAVKTNIHALNFGHPAQSKEAITFTFSDIYSYAAPWPTSWSILMTSREAYCQVQFRSGAIASRTCTSSLWRVTRFIHKSSLYNH